MKTFSVQWLLLTSSLVLVSNLPVQGQSLLLKDYSTQNGLPDSRVAPIIQDHRGYIWFGTQAGLTRYDGNEFTTVAGAKDIPGIFGRAIIEDREGAIWFAYTGFTRGGVIRFKDGEVSDFSGLVRGRFPGCLAEDSTGRIWVGSDSGVTRISFTDAARNEAQATVFPQYPAKALIVDSGGVLWIACANETLYTHTANGFAVSASGLSRHVRTFAIAELRGALWIGSIEGLHVVDHGAMQKYTTADGLPERGVWSFREDRRGNLWVGTAHGLYRAVATGGRYRFRKCPAFGDAIIYDMLVDLEGNVWFASHPGLRKLLASDLTTQYSGQMELSHAGFGPIAQAHDGTMIFGSRNSGIFSLHNGVVRSGRSVRPFTDLTVLAILPETSPRIWFGIKLGGVILQDGATTRRYPDTSQWADWSVHALARLGQGTVLMGTARGLFEAGADFSPRRIQHPAINSSVIFDITVDGRTVWLATDHGAWLGRIERDSLVELRQTDDQTLTAGIVYAILRDTRGRLWFGTDGQGLVLFDNSGWHHFQRDDGLAGNRVYALAEDSLGLLWIGTASGLSQFDAVSFRNFTYDQGFGEIGLHGLTVDREGFVWVSSFPGIARLRSYRFPKSTLPPPVYIDGMQADSLRFVPGMSIQLGPDPAVISFRYAGLSYLDETNVRYRYVLEGLDKHWSPLVRERQVRYTHLPAGRYTFRVSARSADNVWSVQPASISFVILPPWYERWWSLTAFSLLLASAIFAVYRYRLAKALQLERTRSKIAMDLHDDIGSSLTRISVLSEVATRQKEEDRARTLSRIGDTARELIDALDDIVWSVDPRHDHLQDVVRRIVEFGQQLCEGRGIVFETQIPDTVERVRISLEKRRDLYLVFKEAITNVVRHSSASTLVFRVEREDSFIRLQLADDGMGFSGNGTGSGHGLDSMRKRARQIGSRFVLDTIPGQGTRMLMEIRTD